MLAITVRDKLESLCRELQRQNKMLMVYILFFFFFFFTLIGLPYIVSCCCSFELQEECKRVSTEGQTLRSDLSNKFQEAIKV